MKITAADMSAKAGLPPVIVALVKLRKAYGLSQSELARRANISNVLVSLYEAGKVSPSVATVSKVFGVFGWRLVARRENAPEAAD